MDRQVFADRQCVDITRPPPTSAPPPPPPTSHPTRHDRCLSASSQITEAPPFQSPLSSTPTHLQRQGSRNMFPRQAGFARTCTHAHTHHDVAHLQSAGRQRLCDHVALKQHAVRIRQRVTSMQVPSRWGGRPAPSVPLSPCQPHSPPPDL